MQSLGVIEDGFTFTEAELARATPRFWWSARKTAAYARVLACREARGDNPCGGAGQIQSDRAPAAVAAVIIADTSEAAAAAQIRPGPENGAA